MSLLAASLLFAAASAAPAAPPDPRAEWLAKHAVRLRSIDPNDDDFADLQPLRKTLAGVRVVMLGEQDHGDGTTFFLKARLIRFLHEQMGFDVLAFESGLYDCEKAQEHLAAGEPARQALPLCVFAVWTKAREFDPVYDYVDAQRKAGHPFELAGFDCQLTGDAPEKYLVADLRAQGFSDERVERFLPHFLDGSWESGEAPPPPAEEQEAYARTLERWSASAKSPFWQYVLDSLRVFGDIEWHTKLGDNHAASAMRDRQMGKNFVWLARERYKKRKIIVWAATFHNARNVRTVETDVPMLQRLFAANTPMGEFAKNALGKELYSIGVSSAEGEFGRLSAKSKPVPPPSPDSLEALFLRAGLTQAFVDFHHAPPWLHEPIPGQVLFHREQRADWTRVVDGVLYVRRMERVHKSD